MYSLLPMVAAIWPRRQHQPRLSAYAEISYSTQELVKHHHRLLSPKPLQVTSILNS